MDVDRRLSPVRAVMFWTGDYSSGLVRLGMYEYVFKPLGLDLPDDAVRYNRAVDLAFDYATMESLSFEKDFVQAVRDLRCDPPSTAIPKPAGFHFWKVSSRYFTTSVESVATNKSISLSGHVADAESFDDIVPSPVLDIGDLAYSDETMGFLHDLSYTRYHENPVGLTRSLVGYMKSVVGTPVENIHVGSFLHSLVKSHKASLAVKLTLRSRKIGGPCLGPRNRDVKRILDTFTVKVCPWCCKPVNVVVKKKSSAGAAHRSHIFTDDYTQELLYCTEKNHRGIMSYPLLSIGEDGFYANDFEWTINSGFTRVFAVQNTPTGTRMIIFNKKTEALLYVPVIVDTDPCGCCLTCEMSASSSADVLGVCIGDDGNPSSDDDTSDYDDMIEVV
jgi:hypothetical protein